MGAEDAPCRTSAPGMYMLILGYSGHRRHGWNSDKKLASRMRHARRHPLIFDAITSFGEDVEDLPLNLFPLDGVGHDSAAAVLRDGNLVAAAAEERFNRFKHSTSAGGKVLPPRQAVEYCLAEANGTIENVDHIAFYSDFTRDILDQRIGLVAAHLSPKI